MTQPSNLEVTMRPLVMLALLLPATALAAPRSGQNFLGGRVVSKNALVATVGYPDLTVGVKLPVAKTFELTPYFRFEYPVGFAGESVRSLDVALGAELRWQVLDKGIWSGSVTGAVPVHVGFPGVVGGVGLLQPGFMATAAVADVVDIDFGMRFEDDLWFGTGGVGFSASIPFVVGAETEVIPGLSIGGRIEAGPKFGTGGAAGFGGFGGFGGLGFGGLGPGFVTARARVIFGIAWQF